MVAAYHLIWTTYGSWLPNDPRGSTSREVRCAEISPLGELHFGRRPVQPAGQVIREFYEAARGALKHQLLTFSPAEVDSIACGFADVIEQRTYTCYACAIMPDHVHLVIRKHRYQAEQTIEQLQEASRVSVLALESSRRAFEHPVWGGPGWKVYLDTQADIRRTVHYIEQNPVKIGRPVQCWGFVKPYDGWLPGQAKVVRSERLRAKPQAEG